MAVKTFSEKFIFSQEKTSNVNIMERHNYRKCITMVKKRCSKDRNSHIQHQPFIEKVVVFRLESLDDDE